MMSHRVISDDGLKAHASGCAVAIRIPWYRSLPLSVIEVVEVEIDGAAIDLDRVTFSIEGETLALEELQHRTEIWFVLDDAYLNIADAPVSRGSEHDVAVTLAIYPPYIKGYKRMTRTQKRLLAR
jgi:hypothetical protein